MRRMEVIPHPWWNRRSFFVACLPNLDHLDRRARIHAAAHLLLMQAAGLSAGAPELEGVLNRFGGAGQKCAANSGLTPSFRRSLPETGCLLGWAFGPRNFMKNHRKPGGFPDGWGGFSTLSQGLPRGICSPFVVPPKRLSLPPRRQGRCPPAGSTACRLPLICGAADPEDEACKNG